MTKPIIGHSSSCKARAGSSLLSLSVDSHPQVIFSRHQAVTLSAGSFPRSISNSPMRKWQTKGIRFHVLHIKTLHRRLPSFVARQLAQCRNTVPGTSLRSRGPCLGTHQLQGRQAREQFSSTTWRIHSVPERPMH